MSAWEIVIGLETHTQLSCDSKIFSGASTAFGAAANTQACAVDVALPGTLPVMNRAAVERAIRFGLAVGATIAPTSIFARKNYFYPDLPKGYQISQYETPVVAGGALSFMLDSGDGRFVSKTVRLTRAHLEEDAGKSLHQDYAGMSGIDLNRAGTPLLEIVSEPEMRSSAEAVAYAKTLHALVVWLGICDGNMQEGSFRCDANVSVRRPGAALGTRCEIKNLNSFRFLQEAIDFEAQRQIALIEDGLEVKQQTRLWDPDKFETRPMRSKEDADDYRYFPDPDLPPLAISTSWVERIQSEMPELPQVLRTRLVAELGLNDYDATVITSSRGLATYFEAVVSALGQTHAKLAANWLMGDVLAQCNRDGIDVDKARVNAAQLAQLLARMVDGTVSAKIAKELFQALWEKPDASAGAIDRMIDERGLRQISDRGELALVVEKIIAAYPSQAADYRGGKDKLFGFFVGQAMKATGGKANPQELNQILMEKLSA